MGLSRWESEKFESAKSSQLGVSCKKQTTWEQFQSPAQRMDRKRVSADFKVERQITHILILDFNNKTKSSKNLFNLCRRQDDERGILPISTFCKKWPKGWRALSQTLELSLFFDLMKRLRGRSCWNCYAIHYHDTSGQKIVLQSCGGVENIKWSTRSPNQDWGNLLISSPH